jgi:hypothetical protein
VQAAAAVRAGAIEAPAIIGAIAEELGAACAGAEASDELGPLVPLELAIRALHLVAAVELVGAPRLPPRVLAEVARRLVVSGRYLLDHLEDQGVVPANHLLGDLVGLLVIGLAMAELPLGEQLIDRARAGLTKEATRQIGADGAHFEASTAYHRFALELLTIAHLLARRARIDLGLEPTLWRMFRFVRGYLLPDGTEPGFGDGDDAHLLPVRDRRPRDHAYLLSLGAALFDDPALKRPDDGPSEEALWLLEPALIARFDRLAPSPEPDTASFPQGGVHVLRRGTTYVAMRAGSYGQRGIGGHAHNDQLSLVIHHQGSLLLHDPGTGSYTGDPVLRDHLRGTAAHSTLVIDGEEQSPFIEGRPFALFDRARGSAVVEGQSLRGGHVGYRRLAGRVVHRRTVTLSPGRPFIFIDDDLGGRGEVSIEARFQVFGPIRAIGAYEVDLVGRARLSSLGPDPLALRIVPAVRAPRYGTTSPTMLVVFAGRLTLPARLRFTLG